MNSADLNLLGKPRVIKIDRTSILNNDSVKPTKRIAVRENKFWKDCEKHYFSIKNTFD